MNSRLVSISFVSLCFLALARSSGARETGRIDEDSLRAFDTLAISNPEEAIDQGNEILSLLQARKPANATFAKLKKRLVAIEDLRTAIQQAIAEHIRAINLDIINERNILSTVDGVSRSESWHQASRSPAQIYDVFVPQFGAPFSDKGLSRNEVGFIKSFYSLLLTRAIQDLIGPSINVWRITPFNHQIGRYLFIPIALHWKLDGSESVPLNMLPLQFRNPESLDSLAEFVLAEVAIPRFELAVALARLSLTDRDLVFKPGDWWRTASKICEKNSRALVGVECLRRVASGLPNNRKEERIDIRFEMARVLERGGHFFRAAGECGAILHDFPLAQNNIRLEVAMLRIRMLAEQDESDFAVLEIDQLLAMDLPKSKEADLRFQKWQITKKAGRRAEAANALRTFVKMFSNHPRMAEVYLVMAQDCLAAQKYEEARKLLALLMNSFPDSTAARRAVPLSTRLTKLP